MSNLYRAVYTRCSRGRDFYSRIGTGDGQQIFTTTGDMGLSQSTISLITSDLKRDRELFSLGAREYKGAACHFVNYDGISLLLYYQWLTAEQTGSREFALTKALIGEFTSHPMEYYHADFFKDEHYFADYKDVDGQPIKNFKGLQTFQEQTPPLFNVLTKDSLEFANFYPAIAFNQAREYALSSSYVTEKVQAAVLHLVRQFQLPENQRRGIAVKGTLDQIRFWFAAIGYAFSAKAAQKLSFSIGFPPNGFPYSFTTSALVGWDVEDPDVEKIVRMSDKLIWIDSLVEVDSNTYYSAISKFDDEHFEFINSFSKNNDDILYHPDFYASFVYYQNYKKELSVFLSKPSDILDLNVLKENLTAYSTSKFYIQNFYGIVLHSVTKAVPQSDDDIELLVQIYETLEVLITAEVIKEESITLEVAIENLKFCYIHKFTDIFKSMLCDEYTFCNVETAKEPSVLFASVTRKDRWAFEVSRNLIDDNIVMQYASNSYTKGIAENISYSRLSFLRNLMLWNEPDNPKATPAIEDYVKGVFENLLAKNITAVEELQKRVAYHERNALFSEYFYELALEFIDTISLKTSSDIIGLLDTYVGIDRDIRSTLVNEKTAVADILLSSLERKFIRKFTEIFISLLSDAYSFIKVEKSINLSELLNRINLVNRSWAAEVASYLTQDEVIGRFGFLKENQIGQISGYMQAITKPRLHLLSELMKSQDKLMTKNVIYYVSQAFEAVLLQTEVEPVSDRDIYIAVFQPFNDNVDKDGDIGITLYQKTNYLPKQVDKKTYSNKLQEVFLHDLQPQLKYIDSVLGKSLETRQKEVKEYLADLVSKGFPENVLIKQYLELADVWNPKSHFFIRSLFDFFEPQEEHVYPVLYKRSVEELLKKLFNSDSRFENNEYFASLLLQVLGGMDERRTYDTPYSRKLASLWKESCILVDQHMGEIFNFPELKWSESIRSTVEIVKYLCKESPYLPNIDRLHLYRCLRAYDGSEEYTKFLEDIVKLFSRNSQGFYSCDEKYKDEIVSVLKSKLWTGEIYQLILHLFQFDETMTRNILGSLKRIRTIDGQYAFPDLCSAMYERYKNNKNKVDCKTFQQHIKEVYLSLHRDSKQSWDRKFYVTLTSFFELDPEFIQQILASLIDDQKGGGVSLFCEFFKELEMTWEDHKQATDICVVWEQTKLFCNNLAVNSKQQASKVARELERKQYRELREIKEWVTPIADESIEKKKGSILSRKK